MVINIINEYGKLPINIKPYLTRLKEEFDLRFNKKSKATLIFVDEEKIREINYQYRHLDKVTDVISFEEHEDNYLGEIFLCVDKAMQQSVEYGHSLEREMTFLICHGLLHLNGYDHMNEEDEKVMFSLQNEIMDKIIGR